MSRSVDSAMQMTQLARSDAGSPGIDIGLGWHIDKQHGAPVWMHNGQTGGYHSFIVFIPAKKRGVIVLANTASNVDDIGLHLLLPAYPLSKVPFVLPPAAGEEYLGYYALNPGFILHVSREGSRYFVQATGQGRLEIVPDSDIHFTVREVQAELNFDREIDGKITAVFLRQNNVDQSARRLSDAEVAALPTPKQWTSIPLKPEIGDRYVGRYALAPGKIFTVSREGDHYFAQLTGQEKFEIFPSAEKDFFYKVVDAQLSFETDSTGKATGLMLHQNGDFLAKRLP